MTHLTRTTLAFALFLPAAVTAQETLDANADGYVSLDELQVMYPEMDGDAFTQIDTDGDSLLSEDELAAARDTGMIPAEEG